MPKSQPDNCQWEGCDRASSRFGIFCDEHHDASLGVRTSEADPWRDLQITCQRLVRACKAGVISPDEFNENIIARLVYHGMHNRASCWRGCMDVIPPADRAGLLAYLDAHQEPGMFRVIVKSETA